jgi:hypothetical protein
MDNQPTEAMIVEAVALAIRDVTGGENYDYMDFCRDAAKAAIATIRPSREALEEAKRALSDARNTLAKTATGRFGGDDLTIHRSAFDSVLRNIVKARADIAAIHRLFDDQP